MEVGMEIHVEGKLYVKASRSKYIYIYIYIHIHPARVYVNAV